MNTLNNQLSPKRIYNGEREIDLEACPLKITLTYEGSLSTGTSTNAKAKQRQQRVNIRNSFSEQLERLWQVSPLLSTWSIPDNDGGSSSVLANNWIAKQSAHFGDYQTIPLVSELFSLECAVEFRVLRSTENVSGVSDIDNQIKVLLDCLKPPTNLTECEQRSESGAGVKKKLYTLLKDDKLVTKISSINDELLQPVNGNSQIFKSDVRVLIDAYIRPITPTACNFIFFSHEQEVWNHLWDESVPKNIKSLSNNAILSASTQCVFRIRAMNHNYTSATISSQPPMNTASQYAALNEHWINILHPKVIALRDEMLRRMPSNYQHPKDEDKWNVMDKFGVSINDGHIFGMNPLLGPAKELEHLIRHLPC